MRRRNMSAVLVLGLAATLGASAGAAVEPPAAAAHRPGPLPADTAAGLPVPPDLPTVIALPDGFRPEGIATGPGPYAYVGSMADGSIYRADLRTGEGAVIARGPGTPSLGLKADARGRLFVAGGKSGDVRVLDARTGRLLASYRPSVGPAFVNDVVLTRDAAWFTDSTNPVLYRLPLPGGRLPAPDAVERVPLTGDLAYGPGINANGIAPTPDGLGLLVVQSNTGGLFRVDPSGATRRVDLRGASLPNGDGLLPDGRTLFVVQNRLNTVAVLRLNAAGTEGRVVRRITDGDFDVPTTVAAFGARLYLPNARFTTTPTAGTPYAITSVPVPDTP